MSLPLTPFAPFMETTSQPIGRGRTTEPSHTSMPFFTAKSGELTT